VRHSFIQEILDLTFNVTYEQCLAQLMREQKISTAPIEFTVKCYMQNKQKDLFLPVALVLTAESMIILHLEELIDKTQSIYSTKYIKFKRTELLYKIKYEYIDGFYRMEVP
jgi:hypothetical protein